MPEREARLTIVKSAFPCRIPFLSLIEVSTSPRRSFLLLTPDSLLFDSALV